MADKDEHTRLFPGLARQLREKTDEKTGEAAPAGGAPAAGRMAYSSLHFAPPEQVTWQLRFSVVPRGEISEKLR